MSFLLNQLQFIHNAMKCWSDFFFCCRYAIKEAFDAPFIWTKSQLESPAYLKLREAVMSDLGGVLVFSCPCLAGKSWAVKDLIYGLRENGCKAIYINAKKASGSSSFCEFFYSELGCPTKAASHDLSSLLPASEGLGPGYFIVVIDHLEDVLRFPDTREIIVGLARESYEESTSPLRVLVCVGPETEAQQVLSWNSKQKIRYENGL